MSTHAEKYETFLALHDGDTPLLLANAWDPGTAKLLAHLGYSAIATTSAGHAAILGRRDGHVTLDEVLAHAEALAAAARIEAAADAAHGSGPRVVLTARCENYLHGRADLADTIARLQAYQAAGADVLYAPGVQDLADIRTLVASVDLPVNVLALPGTAPVAELGAAGVRRISVGSGFNLVALGATVEAARELLEQGTYGFWSVAAAAAPARA